MAKYLLVSLAVLAVVLGSGYLVYQRGYKDGFRDVQSEWRLRETALVARVAKLEFQHDQDQKEIADEAERTRKEHAAVDAAVRVEYEQRLSASARRAEVYRTQATASAATAGDLAAHAARLDAALERGINLVQRLQAALGLREDQLKLLGEQLQRDRALASERIQ